jgi:hypothetical protein
LLCPRRVVDDDHGVRLLLLAVLVFLSSCDSFFGPYESHSQTVSGCADAVGHLLACCPKYDSFLSCKYMDNELASPDLSAAQSRCLAKTPCDELVRDVEGGKRVCSFGPATKRCR